MRAIRNKKRDHGLRIYPPDPSQQADLGVGFWLINGHRVEVHLYSDERWKTIIHKDPLGAKLESGIWVSLLVP